MTDKPTPIPAATLILFRDRDDAPAELLIVERSKAMAFAAGALVFPGGRVDPGDHVLALDGDDAEDGAARVAAIRETLEESGLAVGFDPAPDADEIAALRAALARGESFGALLKAGGWTLDLASLTPWTRWCPNFRETRTFDTRFYIAAVQGDLPAASVDATENSRLFWASAAEVLAMAERGDGHVIFPTRRNLERLAQFDRFADAAAHAAGIPVRLICPHIEERDGERHLCIPEDAGYPVTSQRLSEAMRG